MFFYNSEIFLRVKSGFNFLQGKFNHKQYIITKMTPTQKISMLSSFMTGPSLGLISGRHSAPFPTPNSIFFSQIDSSKFPIEQSQICWPKLVQSNDIYSSNSVLLAFINVQMALVNAVFKGYYHWSVLWMRVVPNGQTALPLKRHSNVDYYWLYGNRK